MSGEDTEKPHDPTQKKLDDARKRGEIARSPDLLTAAGYGGFLLACVGFGAWSVRQIGTTLEILLDRSDTLAPLMLSDGGHTLAAGLAWRMIGGAAPFVALPAAAVAVVLAAQRAVIFAPTKLAPKLSRISPLANFRNRFGPTGLFEFGKSLVKLSVYSLVLTLFLKSGLPDLIGLAGLGAGPVSAVMARDMISFLSIVLAVAGSIAMIDLIWQHADHRNRNRMSHKEMSDEHKESEGDPMMKQQRRQRGYDIATNRMLVDVPKADVVIVNPTHYAVALKWDRKTKGAPVCVAKGVDEIAARIREAAHSAGVPVRRDPPAARALHASVEIGQEIRREHYAAVAAAIRFAEAMRARKRAGI